MIKRLYFLCFALVALLAAGCDDFDQSMEYAQAGDAPVEFSQRTLLVYMAMNNSLASYADPNIIGLKEGATKSSLAGGRIVVYKTTPGQRPVLLEVKASLTGSYVDTLKYYNYQNSVSTTVLREVIDDVKELAPGRTYALDIGSHASGWRPVKTATSSGAGLLKAQVGTVPAGGHLTRVVMQETSSSDALTLKDFAATIHDGEFEYIMFDACFMGGVEPVYELRNKARWIVASPAEIVAAGMPYRLIVGDLMAREPRLSEVCRKYYEYYNARSNWEQTATIALYDCSKMEALAAATQPIVSANRARIASMQTAELQAFGRWNPMFFFDFEDFIHRLVADPSNPMLAVFDTALSDAIPFKRTTRYVMYGDAAGWVEITKFCGMSVYIPTDELDALSPGDRNYYYAHTAWGSRVYAD